MRTPLPPILYLVVRDYGPDVGIGSPDVIDDRDTAYDVFSDAVESGDPVAVWQIATHGSLPCSIKDDTDAFDRDLHEVCRERGLDWRTVRRIEDAPAPTLLAAE